jgi:hypothetical protein
MNELERRLRPVEIYLIMETFCSINHRKSSIDAIWVEVCLSNFWKQRNWSLEHLLIRRSRRRSLVHSRQSQPDNLTVEIKHAEGKSVSAAFAEINLLSTLKYKRVNRTCCDTCTHRVLNTEYLCIVWWCKLCSWVWWQTWLILLNNLQFILYVSVSLGSSPVKSKILTVCPIHAP